MQAPEQETCGNLIADKIELTEFFFRTDQSKVVLGLGLLEIRQVCND